MQLKIHTRFFRLLFFVLCRTVLVDYLAPFCRFAACQYAYWHFFVLLGLFATFVLVSHVRQICALFSFAYVLCDSLLAVVLFVSLSLERVL